MKLIGNEVEPGEALRKVLGSQPAARSQNEAEYDQKKQLHPSQTRLNKSLSQTTEQNGTHPKAQTTTQPITEMNKLRSQLNPALQPVSSTTTADLSCLLCEKRGMTSEPSCQDSLPDADVCKDGEDQDGDPAADRVFFVKPSNLLKIYRREGLFKLIVDLRSQSHARAPLRRFSAPRAPGTCSASSAPSGLATSPNLAVDLGQDIQFGSS